MKRSFAGSALVLGLLVAALPQATALSQPQARPVSGPARVNSPSIAADHSITFRISAPRASEVLLSGGWPGGGRVAMARDASGIWSVTVPPLRPDIYTYAFEVDGARVLDPANVESQRGGNRMSSLLMVSGPESAMWDFRDVPHGSIEQIWYPAPVLHQGQRRMSVYLPAGYHADPRRRYPVLYLLHGGGGDEQSWPTQGRAAVILDNLIASGAAVPMIVVMPNGVDEDTHARGEALGPTPSAQQRNVAPFDDSRFAVDRPQLPEPYQGYFPESLVRDLIPFVERAYRVRREASQRAVAGLSLGAAQTVVISANNPGMFDYVGVFSGGGMVGEPAFEAQLAALVRSRPRLYWTGAGDDDIARRRTATLYARAREVGLPATHRQIPGGHTWPVWRDFLVDFAPRLFRPH